MNTFHLWTVPVLRALPKWIYKKCDSNDSHIDIVENSLRYRSALVFHSIYIAQTNVCVDLLSVLKILFWTNITHTYYFRNKNVCVGIVMLSFFNLCFQIDKISSSKQIWRPSVEWDRFFVLFKFSAIYIGMSAFMAILSYLSNDSFHCLTICPIDRCVKF